MSDRHGSNTIVCVFGRKGSGKTTMIGRIVEQYIKDHPEHPILAIDFLGDQAFPEQLDFEVKGIEEAADIIAHEDAPRLIIRDPGTPAEEMRAKAFSVMTKALQGIQKAGGALITVDEVDLPQDVGPSYAPADLEMGLRYGRHLNLSLLFASRRPQDVPKLLTSQCDYIFCGAISEARDLKAMKDMGFPDDELPKLPVGSFIMKSLNPYGFRKIIANPF